MNNRDRAPSAALLPHYARTLARVHRDLGIGLRPMADALSETEWRSRLVRWTAADKKRGYTTKRVGHSTVSRREAGANWPEDPDAWIGAYAELSGETPYELWAEAMAYWIAELQQPEATDRAAEDDRGAAAAARQAEKNSRRTPSARRRR